MELHVHSFKYLLLFVTCYFYQASAKHNHSDHKLLLISFDGFRYDYLDRYNLPNFKSMIEKGVHAKDGVRNVFPTKTFPNHYTLVTGLYPESHGIVDNSFYDPKLNESFQMGLSDSKWFDQAEPIWITAKLNGIRSAAYFWPGSEVQLSGTYADYYVAWNESVDFNIRVDDVMKWFAEQNGTFAALYFEQPDGVGHNFGAFSNEVEKMATTMDNLLGYIIKSATEKGFIEKLDLIITSDHGMVNVTMDDEHILLLEDHDPDHFIKLVPQAGPAAAILPIEGKENEVYENLRNAHKNVTVYRRQDIPEQFHYRNNDRIMPILAMADEGYLVLARKTNFSSISRGNHGYSNYLTSMRPIFVAMGPSFKKGITVEVFDTVHIYPLMCHIIGMAPKSNNGSLAEVQRLLSESTITTLDPITSSPVTGTKTPGNNAPATTIPNLLSIGMYLFVLALIGSK